MVRERAPVRQQHVHRLAEPAEREVECGSDVLGLQHLHAGVQVVRVGDCLEEPHRRRVSALEPRQLVHARGKRSLNIGGREDRERVLQLRGHAPVVHHQPVGLLVPVRPVHAGDGLEQGVLLERRIEVHHLLDRRVEAGEQHVAHHQDGERVGVVLEPFDKPVLLVLAQVPARQPRLVVVARRHDHGRLGSVQPVQRLLVGDGGVAARCDHLGLESVGGDESREVVDKVQADRLDAARSAGDGLLGGEALLDDGAFVLGAVGEDAVEDLIDGLPDDLQLREPALVEDGHRRSVPDGLLDGVGVDVGAEGVQRAPVLLVDGGVPVKPRKQALGSAWRMLAARLRYCVRWASSTITKMLVASDRVGWTEPRRAAPPPAPAISWNFWMVVITVLPVGCARMRRRSRTLFARSGFGNPHAVNTPAICRSSLVRSVTMTTVGCCCGSWRRSLSASQSIVRLFPDPCVCQTIPPRALGFRAVRIRRIASLTAMNCL